MRLATVLALALILTAPVAQSHSAPGPPSVTTWVETPSLLTQSHTAFAPYRALYADPISIRRGQQALYFSTGGTAEVAVMEVCIVTQTEACERNGTHWATIYSGPSLPANASIRWYGVPQAEGRHDIKLRYFKMSGNGWYFDYTLFVAPPAQRAFKDGADNSMMLWEGTTAALDSPFLVVEGIDANNVNNETDYYALAGGLLGLGRARGADVFILNFDDGGHGMVQNAAVVESAIQYVNGMRTGSRKLDVAGISMGGVIVRYALADMEHRGVAHNVGRFVSIDAPQQGAVLDANLLNWIYNPPYYATSFEPPANLTSLAGKQLLQYNPFDTTSPTAHTRFFNRLNARNGDGYPHQTLENIGVSFGTPSPNPAVEEEEIWLEIEIDVFPLAGSTSKKIARKDGRGPCCPGSSRR